MKARSHFPKKRKFIYKVNTNTKLEILSYLLSLTWFRLVNSQSLKDDFMAGLTGAVIVLPEGVAFATIAGLPAGYGLYTAMVTPVIADNERIYRIRSWIAEST